MMNEEYEMASNTKANETAPAVTAEDEEWMDGAKTAFPSIENLAPSLRGSYGPGRLVAIWAVENGVGQSTTTAGKTYGYTETITLVLDDGPDGTQTDELIGAAPVRLEMRHSTTGLHSRLKPRVDGVNAKGIKLRFRPMVGRINTQESKNSKNQAAFSISDPSPEDMVTARKYKDMILSINQELEAKAASDEDSAAFD
jgi:hypothetical protein